MISHTNHIPEEVIDRLAAILRHLGPGWSVHSVEQLRSGDWVCRLRMPGGGITLRAGFMSESCEEGRGPRICF